MLSRAAQRQRGQQATYFRNLSNWAAARPDIRPISGHLATAPSCNYTRIEGYGYIPPSILAQLDEGATAKCPDIGRIPGRATAQLDRFLKYVMLPWCPFISNIILEFDFQVLKTNQTTKYCLFFMLSSSCDRQ